jgi:hypothetical protein
VGVADDADSHSRMLPRRSRRHLASYSARAVEAVLVTGGEENE